MERRSDDPKMFETAVELVDCSVPSRTTNEKAEIPVSDRPPNSIDSDVEEDEANDARLSQSTTDTGVHIELPEVNTEMDDQAIAESVHTDASVCAGDATDEPVAPGCVATPVVSKVVGARRSVVLAEYNRRIDEIDASALMQVQLRKRDPTLASASSFLDVVTGGGTKRKRSVKEAGNVPATEGGDVPVATKVVDVLPPPSAKYLEKQRTTCILAAESLIRDELRKVNPSETSIAAFRKAAYGDGGVPTTDVSGEMREKIVHTTEDTTSSLRVLPAVKLSLEEGERAEKLQEGEFTDAEIVAPDDTGMSIDESDEEQTG